MPKEQIGAFIPTTSILDTTELYETDVTSPAFKELLVRLYQILNMMAININLKETGYYVTSEFVTGQKFFPTNIDSTTQGSPQYRETYRKVVNFGALPNTATKSVAHGITCDANTIFTKIQGNASDQTNKVYLPLPYASSTLINNIELYVDSTNVNIITGSNRSTYLITYVILEYIKL